MHLKRVEGQEICLWLFCKDNNKFIFNPMPYDKIRIGYCVLESELWIRLN